MNKKLKSLNPLLEKVRIGTPGIMFLLGVADSYGSKKTIEALVQNWECKAVLNLS